MGRRSTSTALGLVFLGAMFLLASCESDKPSAPVSSEPRAAGHLEWVEAPAGEDVATIVKRELERARKDGRDLLVYVGAVWCEPCERFHRAAEKGELDGVFPRLRVVAFDLDKDAERLAVAGYVSQMIPLFVAPGDDGRASDRRIEGSVKGEAAIGDLSARLRRILPRSSAGP